MKQKLLLAAYAKTERADAQIHDLNIAIRAFFKSSPYRMRSNLNADRTQEIWKFELTRKLPAKLSIMAGEILHNLRSPLDQVLSAVAILHGRRLEPE